MYALRAPAAVGLRLSAEHDGYAWLPYDEALARIRPALVRASFEAAVGMLEMGA